MANRSMLETFYSVALSFPPLLTVYPLFSLRSISPYCIVFPLHWNSLSLPAHYSLHLALPLSAVLKHLHLSLSFRSPLFSLKGATVCECGQARLVSAGKPLLFIWLFILGDVNTRGQITDDMWKHSIVKTLEKTCLHQSLRIRECDKKGLKRRKMDSRKKVNLGCLFLTTHRSINCPFSLLFYCDLPFTYRELTPAHGIRNGKLRLRRHWRRSLFISVKSGQGQSWQGSQEKLAVCIFSHVRPVHRTQTGCLLRWSYSILLFPLPVGLALACSQRLLCNYCDTQPLTITATLPVDQSNPFLARGVCRC